MTALAVPLQRETALARANEIRLDRARLKPQIAAGNMTVPQLLADLPECIASWPVSHMLMCQNRWARTRTLKLLKHLQISELRPVGQLTERQRDELAKAILRGPATR